VPLLLCRELLFTLQTTCSRLKERVTHAFCKCAWLKCVDRGKQLLDQARRDDGRL
jgi:hypothetical protein